MTEIIATASTVEVLLTPVVITSVITPIVLETVVTPVGIQGPPGEQGGSETFVDAFALKFKQAALGNYTAAYEEKTYAAGYLYQSQTWTDNTKTTLLCTETRTYTAGKLVQSILTNAAGETLTQVLVYDGNNLSQIQSTIATVSTGASWDFSQVANAQYLPLLRFFLGR